MAAPSTQLPYRTQGPRSGPQTAGRGRQLLSLPLCSQLCSVVTLAPQR